MQHNFKVAYTEAGEYEQEHNKKSLIRLRPSTVSYDERCAVWNRILGVLQKLLT